MKNTLTPFRNRFGSSSMFSDLDTMFDDFFREGWMRSPTTAPKVFAPNVDIAENEDFYMISADLPGMKKDEIEVAVKDGVLTLSGERHRESESTDAGYHRVEKTYGQFKRSFQLPTKIDEEKIQARHEDGVLEVLIPKTEMSQTKSVKVESGKSGLFSRLLGNKDEEPSNQ